MTNTTVKPQAVGKNILTTSLYKILMRDVEAHLHLVNDDSVCGEVVMGLCCAIVGLSPTDAFQLVIVAHNEGESCLFVGDKSKCEKYQKQFAQHGVTTKVIEPNT